jgi:hypothetical protein
MYFVKHVNPHMESNTTDTSITTDVIDADRRRGWRDVRQALESVGITPKVFFERESFIISTFSRLLRQEQHSERTEPHVHIEVGRELQSPTSDTQGLSDSEDRPEASPFLDEVANSDGNETISPAFVKVTNRDAANSQWHKDADEVHKPRRKVWMVVDVVKSKHHLNGCKPCCTGERYNSLLSAAAQLFGSHSDLYNQRGLGPDVPMAGPKVLVQTGPWMDRLMDWLMNDGWIQEFEGFIASYTSRRMS